MKPAQPTFSRPVTMLLVTVFLMLVLIELLAILVINHGQFMFTLDDPYIHLALAENIWQGHYGVNSQEFSAPSSSILWPLLIAPFTAFQHAPWLVLLLNIVASIVTLILVASMLGRLQQDAAVPLSRNVQLAVAVLFMLAVNLAGLSLVGMEHNIQVLLASTIACGLLEKLRTQHTSPVLLVAIVAAPLIRYENAIISAVALLFLFANRDYIKSILAGILIVLFCGMFSAFLLSLGLQYLPDSILAKSDLAARGLFRLSGNIADNLLFPNTPKAVAMLLLAVFFIAFASARNMLANQRLLAGFAALALLLHISGARVGWYFRYEMALWAFSLIVFFYCFMQLARGTFLSKAGKAMAILILLVAVFENIAVLGTTPLAASNVYHQQYQMHRFITEVYKKPVAVNDLGWASYQNNDYVLDLWGLGSSKARELRKNSKDVQWMDNLAAGHNIGLAMIYNNTAWFPQVPSGWIKVAEMDVTGPRITAWYPVSFFVRDKQQVALVRAQLATFADTLPEGSSLRFIDQD